MAIISEYQSEQYGISSQDAYTKLSTFYVNNIPSTEKTVAIFTETWINKQARLENKKPIGNNNYLMTSVSELFTFADIYNFIKSQPQFVNPIDDI